LPVKIVELTIDAYEKTAGDVGGEVDIVVLSKEGGVTWLQRKQNCPEKSKLVW
jgi:hypothetical protein